jgi:hypothetical protein
MKLARGNRHSRNREKMRDRMVTRNETILNPEMMTRTMTVQETVDEIVRRMATSMAMTRDQMVMQVIRNAMIVEGIPNRGVLVTAEAYRQQVELYRHEVEMERLKMEMLDGKMPEPPPGISLKSDSALCATYSTSIPIRTDSPLKTPSVVQRLRSSLKSACARSFAKLKR